MRKSAKEYSKIYHKRLYEQAKLFEPGSWLEEKDEDLLKLVDRQFGEKDNIRILDLGSGIGRNAIPMAKIVGPRGGRVIAVDFLKIAIQKLQDNAEKHGVEKYIEYHVSDVEEFQIESTAYDLIVAISVLEHGSTDKEHFHESLRQIMAGTKKQGINYLAISTGLKETDAKTGESLPTDIAIDLTYEEARRLLKDFYKEWKKLNLWKDPYKEKFVKDGKEIIWQTDYLYFVAQNIVSETNIIVKNLNHENF